MVSVLEAKTSQTLLDDGLMTTLASDFEDLRLDYDDSKQLTPLMFDFNAIWSNVVEVMDIKMELPIRNDDGFHAVIAKAAFTPAA
jgi:hypothetical protein